MREGIGGVWLGLLAAVALVVDRAPPHSTADASSAGDPADAHSFSVGR